MVADVVGVEPVSTPKFTACGAAFAAETLSGGQSADSNGGTAGVGGIGAGAGFGAGFFFFFAGIAFFIPFFLRAGAPRFVFLDFFATFNLPNRSIKLRQQGITQRKINHSAERRN